MVSLVLQFIPLSLCLARSQDGTVILWQYESGRELQSWDMRKLREATSSTKEEEEGEEKVTDTTRTFPITWSSCRNICKLNTTGKPLV